MKRLLLVAACGCGRGFFNPMPSPVDGATVDATVGPPITCVQSNSTLGTNTQLQVTFSLAERAGDVEVIVVGWVGTNAITALNDGQGSSFTSVIGPESNAGTNEAIFVSSPINAEAGGLNIVSVDFDGLAMATVAILEYAGVDPTTPIDAVVGNAGFSTVLPTTNALTATHANDLLLVATNSDGALTGSVNGFVQRVSNEYFLVEDQHAGSTGVFSAELPMQGSDWVMQLVALRGQ